MDVFYLLNTVVTGYQRCPTAARDPNCPTSLFAEGSSSADAVLVPGALPRTLGFASRLQHSPAPRRRKLIGITDGRQDAALQPAHSNSSVE